MPSKLYLSLKNKRSNSTSSIREKEKEREEKDAELVKQMENMTVEEEKPQILKVPIKPLKYRL